MPKTQFATRVDDEQAQKFKSVTSKLGTTPADALRIFICTFNEAGGFPYDVRLSSKTTTEPFDNEADATQFATSLAFKTMQ